MRTSQRWVIGCVISAGLGCCLLAPPVSAQDQPSQSEPPKVQTSAVAGPSLRTYSVPDGSAEPLAKMLQEVYKDSSKVRIVALSPSKIAVYAAPEHQLDIAKSLLPPTSATTELIPLAALDAVRVATTLRAMFGDPKAGGPFVEGDPVRNALIIRGSIDQLQEVKEVLRALGEGPGQAGNVRIFTLERGSAITMAQALQNILQQMRVNPVKVVTPASLTGPPRVEPPRKGDPEKKDARPGKADAPITLTAFSNRLVVTTDDPQALALVAELFRMLQAAATAGDFEVVRLKNAKAVNAARILDEVFNGTRPGRGGTTGAPAVAVRADRVRVVADPDTNSLLIQASPLDMLTIRNLLSQALDAGPTDSEIVNRTWVLGPFKYARATDIAGVIKAVYAKESPLSVGVDERTNSLVLGCSEALYRDIEAVASRLDAAARDAAPDKKGEPRKDEKK